MSQGNDLSPQDAGVEAYPVGFDFGPDLLFGESIQSVTSVSVRAVPGFGLDPDAGQRILSLPLIVTSQTTGRVNGQINILFGYLMGAKYLLQCVVQTNLGQYSLYTHISGVVPS
jgi:hypothetical protein